MTYPSGEVGPGHVGKLPQDVGSTRLVTSSILCYMLSKLTPQSTEVHYLDHGEPENEPIEKVYVTTLVTPMGLASSFNGGISKIIAKKSANFENSINNHKNGLVWCM